MNGLLNAVGTPDEEEELSGTPEVGDEFEGGHRLQDLALGMSEMGLRDVSGRNEKVEKGDEDPDENGRN